MSEYHSGRIGHRHGLMVLAFFGMVFMYATRAVLSVSMVAMVEPILTESVRDKEGLLIVPHDACPGLATNLSAHALKNRTERGFEWDSTTQGLLHSAFYYGYLLPQVFGGWISHKLGAKYPIGISVLFVGLFTLLSPLAAEGGVWMFFAVRLFTGLAQGIVWPALTALWSPWAPPVERGRLVSATYTGAMMGIVVGMSLAGVIAAAFKWQAIYYFYGVGCCIWTVLWMFLAHSKPEDHPWISTAERDYIVAAVGSDREDSTMAPVPWRKIFRTVPFWTLLAVEFCHSWAFYTLLTNLPTYMSNILHFSLKSNGFLSAMPYLCRFLITTVSLYVSDWILVKKYWTTTTVRKFFGIGAFVGSGGALAAVGFVGCNGTAAVSLFTFAVGISGWVFAGHLINFSDMSPRFCGVLVGVANSVGTISGIVAPMVVGLLTSGVNGQSIANWRTAFLIAAGLYVVVTILYGFFGSAERQEWDSPADEEKAPNHELKPLADCAFVRLGLSSSGSESESYSLKMVFRCHLEFPARLQDQMDGANCALARSQGLTGPASLDNAQSTTRKKVIL